ncbi:MAG: Methyltransferase domain [Actinomycetia bacterium]|nr:Methyltransferase domain [Actinomycetes bacterium]
MAEEGPESRDWFLPIARHLGPAYLRQSFTQGTDQEVAFLIEALELRPGARVLDVGCGPGRHALGLARAGFDVVGIDLSEEFISLARAAAAAEGIEARFEVRDARDLAFRDEFDGVVSICQGGFGLLGGRAEETVMGEMAAALRPGGVLALDTFSAGFVVRFLEAGEAFDPDTGVLHEVATVKGEGGVEQPFDLWTTCWTPRELRLLSAVVGLDPIAVHASAPGRFGRRIPSLEEPGLLLLARKPGLALHDRTF